MEENVKLKLIDSIYYLIVLFSIIFSAFYFYDNYNNCSQECQRNLTNSLSKIQTLEYQIEINDIKCNEKVNQELTKVNEEIKKKNTLFG